MCELCRNNPCISKCPNYEQKIIEYCYRCNNEIYENNEEWTDLDNNIFCSKECAIEYYGIKQK